MTKHFVFVHLPKTGGSFVTDVLSRVSGERDADASALGRLWHKAKRRLTPARPGSTRYAEFLKHGTCNQIPQAYRELPILSVFRNPFDWYVSNFKFGWWRTHPEIYPGLESDPRWPDLDFAAFMELSSSRWLTTHNPGASVNPNLGRLTVLFLNYYARDPESLIAPALADDELARRASAELYPVEFLDTRTLNVQLHEYLLATGMPPETLAFVLEKEKISPRNNRSADETWPSFYTREQYDEVLHRDRLLFDRFPRYREEARQLTGWA